MGINRASSIKNNDPEIDSYLNAVHKADTDIHHEVCEALTENPRLLTNGIEIEIKNGVVFLRGNVMSRFDKREVERCVEKLVGVSDVMNELRFEQ